MKRPHFSWIVMLLLCTVQKKRAQDLIHITDFLWLLCLHTTGTATQLEYDSLRDVSVNVKSSDVIQSHAFGQDGFCGFVRK